MKNVREGLAIRFHGSCKCLKQKKYQTQWLLQWLYDIHFYLHYIHSHFRPFISVISQWHCRWDLNRFFSLFTLKKFFFTTFLFFVKFTLCTEYLQDARNLMQRCEETAQTEERKEIAEVTRRKSEKKNIPTCCISRHPACLFYFSSTFFIFDD